MRRVLVASSEQIEEVGELIKRLGVGVYRDAKKAAGVKWYDPFSRLYRLDAGTVIEIMKEQIRPVG